MSTDSLGELKLYSEQKLNIQPMEIHTLQEKLDMMTCLMQEKEATFQQKLAEEEAKTAQANAKFEAYKEELVRFNREQQNYLKEQWNSHKNLKEELSMMNCLLQEKEATFQQKLSQEEALRQELVSQWNEQRNGYENMLMLLQDQNEELLERLQRTEKSEHSAKVENEELKEKCKEFEEMSTNLTEELGELKLNVEQERNIQHTEINTLQEKLDMMTCLLQEKEATFQQKLMEESAKMAQDREEHQEQIAALKSQLEGSTIRAKENTITLLRKLSQEEALRQELVSQWNEQRDGYENTLILLQDQNEELLERQQQTEKSERSAKVEFEELREKFKEFKEMSTNVAEELGELKLNVEEERNIQHTEIHTLQEKLDMMTCLMQEKAATFQQKLAEEEAKTAQANAKFEAYKKELVRFNREQQNYLKEKRNNHKYLEEQLRMMNCLLQETEACFQQKLMEESAKMAQEREHHREQIAALKSLLERSAIHAKENTIALLRKLSQEEALRQELVSQWNEQKDGYENMLKLLQDQNEELLERQQQTEKSERSAKVEFEELREKCKEFEEMSTNLAEELGELKLNVEEERNIQHTEIHALQVKLDMMTCLLQEKEATFQQKLAEEEAKTAQANAKFEAYKKELVRFNREQQNYLKEKRNNHKYLEEQLRMMNCLLQETEACFQQKLMEESAKMAQEREHHREQIAALKSLLERSAIHAKENTITLLRKLSQEEALRQEWVSQWNEQKDGYENMLKLLQDQNEELLERQQQTEKSERSAKVEFEELREKCKEFEEMSTNLAEELGELKLNVEEERNIQHTEIHALQVKLDMMTCLLQEKEATFQQKLAEEEAKTAQANAKFEAYKKELVRFNREQQNYLKEKRNNHKYLEEQLRMMNCLLQETEACFQQKLMEESAKMAQEREHHREQIAALKSLLERSAIHGKENTITLLRKLSQEEALRQELVSQWNEQKDGYENMLMLLQNQNEELLERLQRTEKSERSAKVEIEELREKFKEFKEMSTNVAEELGELKLNVEEERNIQHMEIHTLQEKLDMMTCLMQEKAATFQQKLAEEEAKTAQANAKFEAYKKELVRFNREQQNYLKEKRNNHKYLEEQLRMMNCLLQETEACFQQKLMEESAKMAQEREHHREQIAALKSLLERSAIHAKENTIALLRKLSQEEALLQELVSQWKEQKDGYENMLKLLQDQNEELLERQQRTEKSERSAKVEIEELREKCKEFEEMSTNLAEELGELKLNVEEERNIQHTEIHALQEKIDMMTCLLQEKEATFQQKLAEEEAKTAQANAKFEAYKKELVRFNREQQNYLKEKGRREAQEKQRHEESPSSEDCYY